MVTEDYRRVWFGEDIDPVEIAFEADARAHRSARSSAHHPPRQFTPTALNAAFARRHRRLVSSQAGGGA
jgi:hypothetical protein